MGYTVIDIIDKSIEIELKRKNILISVESEGKNFHVISLMSKVLIKDIDSNIEEYSNLKEEMLAEKLDSINFEIYDKISALIIEFNKKKYMSKSENVEEYLNFSLDLDKDTYSLFVDIQGRFVQNIEDINTKTYIVLSKIIDCMEKRICSHEETLKKITQNQNPMEV